jgi:hypothetical protein
LLEYKTKMETAYEFREKEVSTVGLDQLAAQNLFYPEQVENELHSLKRQFDTELERITGFRDAQNFDHDPPTISLSSSSRPATATADVNAVVGGARRKHVAGEQKVTAATNRRPNQKGSSDEENNRPGSTRSERMAKIFAEVTRDAKEQLKRPAAEDHSQRRTPLVDGRNKAAAPK